MVPSLGITVRNRRDPPLPACHSSDTVLASGVPPGSRAEFPALAAGLARAILQVYIAQLLID